MFRKIKGADIIGLNKIDRYIKELEKDERLYQKDILTKIINGEYWLPVCYDFWGTEEGLVIEKKLKHNKQWWEPIIWIDGFDKVSIRSNITGRVKE